MCCSISGCCLPVPLCYLLLPKTNIHHRTSPPTLNRIRLAATPLVIHFWLSVDILDHDRLRCHGTYLRGVSQPILPSYPKAGTGRITQPELKAPWVIFFGSAITPFASCITSSSHIAWAIRPSSSTLLSHSQSHSPTSTPSACEQGCYSQSPLSSSCSLSALLPCKLSQVWSLPFLATSSSLRARSGPG